MQYIASNGSKWNICPEFPPVPVRHCDWSYQNDDQEAECGHASTPEKAIEEIENFLLDNAAE